jgi:diguanylate cyclase (GGDEF)-like protein
LVRYGGEEFLLVLPAAARADLSQVAERLRHMVESAVVADGEQAIRVTVSVGGVAYPETDVEMESDLVKLADKALYRAKETGRNRVVLA